jgi:ubiquitin-protein ligase
VLKQHNQKLAFPLSWTPLTPFPLTNAEDNLRYFNVMILGPSSSPYEGGVFKLELFLPDDYPMAPPKVRR